VGGRVSYPQHPVAPHTCQKHDNFVEKWRDSEGTERTSDRRKWLRNSQNRRNRPAFKSSCLNPSLPARLRSTESSVWSWRDFVKQSTTVVEPPDVAFAGFLKSIRAPEELLTIVLCDPPENEHNTCADDIIEFGFPDLNEEDLSGPKWWLISPGAVRILISDLKSTKFHSSQQRFVTRKSEDAKCRGCGSPCSLGVLSFVRVRI